MSWKNKWMGTFGALLVFAAAGACASTHSASPSMTATVASPPAGAAQPARAAAGTSGCFDVEALAPDDRAMAENVLLTFGDREGLYTLAGGLKPMSSGMGAAVRVGPEVDRTALGHIEQRRRVAQRLRCGDIGAFVLVFDATREGKTGETMRDTEIVLFHRASIAAAISRHDAYFGKLGITPGAEPAQIVDAIDRAPRAERWRGYGYLYGFPDEAVEFFAAAGIEGDATKKVVPRDFRRVETWVKYPDTTGGPPVLGAFVYAVPKGAADSAADKALRDAAAPIYRRYAGERPRYVKADGTGAAALWRAWMMAAGR
jgi:hypothetical protein